MFIITLIVVLLAVGLAAPYWHCRYMEKQVRRNIAEFERQLKEQSNGKV